MARPAVFQRRFNMVFGVVWIVQLAASLLISICAFGEPRYAPTDLESILDSQFVQSMESEGHGETWISTQRGLISLSGTHHAPLNRLQSVEFNGRPLPDIVTLKSTTSGALYAATASGDVYGIDRKSHQASKVFEINRGSAISKPKIYSFGLYLVTTSDGVLFNHLDSVARGHGPRNQTSLIQGEFSSNPLFIKGLGICAASGPKIACGLESDEVHGNTLFSSPDNEDVSLLVSSGDSDIVIAWGKGSRAFLLNTSGYLNPIEVDTDPIRGDEVRAAVVWKSFLVAGTDRGVYFIDLLRRQTRSIDLGSMRRITNFHVTSHGLWVLSESGVALLVDSEFGFWPRDHVSAPIETLSVLEVGSSVLVGTYQGLFLLDREKQAYSALWPLEAKTWSQDTRITSLAAHNGKIFAGTFSGELHVFDASADGTLIFRYTNELGSGISTLRSTTHGLLIGTSRDGVLLQNNLGVLQIDMPASWHRDPSPVTSFTPLTRESGILFTTEREVGLLCLSDRVVICHSKALTSPFRDSGIVSSSILDHGYVVLGTLHSGVIQVETASLLGGGAFSGRIIPGSSDRSFYTLEVDDKGGIWGGTNDGLVLLNSSDGYTHLFSRLDGLINTDITHGASTTLANGDLVIGGPNGFNIVPRNYRKTANLSPLIRLDSVFFHKGNSAFSGGLPSRSVVSLPYGNHGVTFSFSVNDFRDFSRNTYRFSLEGWDPFERQSSGSGKAVFGRLPPGSYTFRARGADASGVWSDNELVIPVEVLPPPWRTWWAYASYFVLAFVLFSIVRRSYDSHVVRKHQIAQAAEDALALARLEDDYQQQQEANERLLRSATPSALALLNAVEAAVSGQASLDAAEQPRVQAILDKIDALRRQQELSIQTAWGETTNLRSLLDELASGIAAATPGARQVILLNECIDEEIPSHHARYLALVLHEVLVFAMTRGADEGELEPIVRISVSSPVSGGGADPGRYRIVLEDSDRAPCSDEFLEHQFPVSLYLTESIGGSFVQETVEVYRLEIELFVP